LTQVAGKDFVATVRAITDEDGRVLAAALLDLTVYAGELTLAQFEASLRLYLRVCPKEAVQMYMTPETVLWDSVTRPVLLPSELRATAGLPFMESVRRRILGGRPVDLRLWDRNTPQCWSFMVYRGFEHDVEYAVYRMLMPIDTPAEVLESAALGLADEVEFVSGHGGYAFICDATRRAAAMRAVYPLAMRYWCVDVEDLDQVARRMGDAAKGVAWLTLIGDKLATKLPVAGVNALRSDPTIGVTRLRHGGLLRAGARPVPGDIHRRREELEPYFKIAAVLGPVLLQHPAELPGPFSAQDTSESWYRRFAPQNRLASSPEGTR
jgi:hypothetical protein